MDLVATTRKAISQKDVKHFLYDSSVIYNYFFIAYLEWTYKNILNKMRSVYEWDKKAYKNIYLSSCTVIFVYMFDRIVFI